MRRLLRLLSLLIAGPCLGGCSSLGYYAQLASGQIQLLSHREPIADIVADPQRDPQLRRRLGALLDARRFAVTALHLPDNGSYTRYADLRRDYVVWNVFATPELSLAPVESCFPIAGCLAYRGYYSKAKAEQHAKALSEQGNDVAVGGVPAYSTLGWFDDPVLNTMMRWSDAHLFGTLFHELAHQKLYVKGDTAFNESFASFVEQRGRRQYLQARGLNDADEEVKDQHDRQFVQLVMGARARLAALYGQALEPSVKRSRKAAEFVRLKQDYEALRDREWPDDHRYDQWFSRELNNARLLPFGLYDEYLPAFAALFADAGEDWPRFYQAAAALGKLNAAARLMQLKALNARSPTA